MLPWNTETSQNPTVGSSSQKFSAAYIDEIRIGHTASGTIDTASGDLTLDSTSGTTNINDILNVTGASTFNNNVTIKGSGKTFAIQNDSSVNKFTVASNTGDTVVGGALTASGTVTGTKLISNIADGGDAPLTVTSKTKVINLNADYLEGYQTATANTLNAIVRRDASGNFTAGTITAALSGNATSASAVYINSSSDTGTWYVSLVSGSGNQTPAYDAGLTYNASTNNLSVGNNITASGTIQGTQLISTIATGTAPISVGSSTQVSNLNVQYLNGYSSATANTLNAIVRRDASGNFTAGTITAALSGNATSASAVYINSSSDTGTWYVSLVSGSGNQTPAYDAGLTYDAVNNALSVSGDITAFASDERLKTNIKPLENALEKVLSLSGFTYNFNEIGESLGFNTELTHVGVSAQQIQAVLPEAVAPAPANNDYLTVKYEKIVPLLIEAIKELADKVEKLEQKLSDK